MKLKTTNIVLSFLLISLILAIVNEEIKYKRNERFDWTSDVDVADSTNTIRVIEGVLVRKFLEHDIIDHDNWNKILYSGNFQTANSHENELLPDSLKIKWFSYNDNSFYEIKDKISYERIIDILKNYKNDNLKFEIVFNKKGKIDLYFGVGFERKQIFITSFDAKKINHKWEFSKNRNRDVFLMNSKIKFNPYLEINSDSKFKDCSAFLFDENRFGYDSISKGKLFQFSSVIKSKPFKSISFELNNDKFQNGELYFDLDFSEDELFNCLTKMDNSPKKLEVKLDEKDSVKSVFLSDSEMRFQLKELND